jgi:hypothetical protein
MEQSVSVSCLVHIEAGDVFQRMQQPLGFMVFRIDGNERNILYPLTFQFAFQSIQSYDLL